MEEVYDLCVIGAGCFGSASARHASANPGIKVCLVGPDEPAEEERPTREIFSCHYDEGRITRVLDDNPIVQTLARRAISRYREIEYLSGIPFYQPVGFLCIGQKGSAFMQKMVSNAGVSDIPLIDLSHADILKQRYPYLNLKQDEYALLEDIGGGHISPRNLVAAQKVIAVNQGCRLVRDIVEHVGPLSEKGYHQIVTKSGSVLRARRILVCTGSFTNFNDLIPASVAEDVRGRRGLPDITVRQETAAFIKIREQEARCLSSLPSMVIFRNKEKEADSFGAYILPPILYPDGQFYLKIGHFDEFGKSMDTLQEIKQWYLGKGDQEAVNCLSQLLIEILGLVVKPEDVSGMACATCRSPSGLPYIERVSPTLTLAVVGHGKGAKFSEEVGRIAANLSLYGKWVSELSQDQFRVIWK